MPIPRQYILRGPCQVQFGGQTFYSKDAVVVDLNTKTGKITSTAIGKVDERIDDYNASIKFTPDGQTTNALLALLYPFFQSAFYAGQSIFGSVDTPLTVWTRDGWKHVFSCAAVSKQPQFNGSAVKTPYGAMEFRAIRANNSAWSAAGSLVAVSQATYPGDAAFSVSNIITTPFSAMWAPSGYTAPTATITADSDASPDVVTTTAAHGFIPGDRVTISGVTGDLALNGTLMVATVPSSTTLTLNFLNGSPVAGTGSYVSGGTITRANGFDGAFTTEAGFMLDSNVTLNEGPECETDDGGLIDISYQEMDVTLKCIPVGPTPQEILNAAGVQGSGAVRGRSLNALGKSLVLSGNGLYAKLTAAGIRTMAPIRADAKVKRVGEITWAATATFTAGVPQPLGQISTTALTA